MGIKNDIRLNKEMLLHRDGNKRNNRLSNLQPLTEQEHAAAIFKDQLSLEF
ncbi:MAG: HNH endonuclease [Holosporaceae bacterium]|jgi:hypothetical protein|nr:HNH endonuclease [Holosporaceae bacterium]